MTLNYIKSFLINMLLKFYYLRRKFIMKGLVNLTLVSLFAFASATLIGCCSPSTEHHHNKSHHHEHSKIHHEHGDK